MPLKILIGQRKMECCTSILTMQVIASIRGEYLSFSLGVCVILAILLGVCICFCWITIRKNRVLVRQIDEWTAKNTADNQSCVESHMDKLCESIHNILHKDKAYRNPSITQELVIVSLNTNYRTFTEAMKHCLKMSFKDYLNSLRLKDALQLLEQSNMTLEEISDVVGFGTSRTFRDQFKAKYNITLTDYRHSLKKITGNEHK